MERPVLGWINNRGLIVMFMCFIEKKNRIPLWGDLLLLILGFFFGALIAEKCTLSLLGSIGYENVH